MSALEVFDFTYDQAWLGSKNAALIDLMQLLDLWKRIMFNVLVSNTDDHLRNHCFLHDGNSWTLSPVYDRKERVEMSNAFERATS